MIDIKITKNAEGKPELCTLLSTARLIKDLQEYKFYCLKREKVFRLTNKTTKETIKLPIIKEFYGPRTNVIFGGMGWWQDMYFKTEINCSDGKLEIENRHPTPTEYEITEVVL
jgi:hypothetical protein